MPGSDNTVAIELIATHIHRKLRDRSRYLRKSLARCGPMDLSPRDAREHYFPNLTVLPETPQLQVCKCMRELVFTIIPWCEQGIFTTLRDRNTSREDFIFFTDRLSTLLSEKAMEFLPYAPKDVITPISATYAGCKLAVEVSYPKH